MMYEFDILETTVERDDASDKGNPEGRESEPI